MAAAAQIVEGMGADIVDVNMGCPVPKIAKHNAGCSLMREPAHAADVVRAMARAVKIPVTVKMRAGWDAETINAPDLARRMEDAGAAAVAVHGRTAAQSYSGVSDWDLIAEWPTGVSIPVFGSGDCIDPAATGRSATRAACRRSARRARRAAQSVDLRAGGRAGLRPRAAIGDAGERGQFLLDYVDLLLNERIDEAEGFRHVAPGQDGGRVPACARSRSVGHQQAARAEFLVHQRARQRIASAYRDQRRGIDRPASGHHPALLFDSRIPESPNR